MNTMSAHYAATMPRRRPVPTSSTRTYLFIYRVRHQMRPPNVDDERFCTVLALGRDQREAERIAINCVHQHGWHILRTDTATALADTDLGEGELDAVHRADLRAYGTSFRLHK
jgi:hypothetical protein